MFDRDSSISYFSLLFLLLFCQGVLFFIVISRNFVNSKSLLLFCFFSPFAFFFFF